MNITAEQEIAGIMAAAIGRLHQRPGAMGPDGGDATEGRHDRKTRQTEVDRDGHEHEQPNPQEEQA
jgi:hypothetical protein